MDPVKQGNRYYTLFIWINCQIFDKLAYILSLESILVILNYVNNRLARKRQAEGETD